MRKRLLLTAAVLTLTFAFAGCGSSNTANNETKTEATTEAKTEAKTEAMTETTTDGAFSATNGNADLTGYETFNNVSYKLSDEWSLYSNTSGTRLYTATSLNETFAVYVQNEVLYSKSDMEKAYESKIFSTYGSSYTTDSKKLGSLTWNVYHFGTDNILNSSACVDVYLYSDGKTTIYLENAYQAGSTASGSVEGILSSMVIK